MALTQEQKKTISEISQNPNKLLETFQQHPYYLHSFKNEFFQDGRGLVDQVLYQYLLTNNDDYLTLYKYIIDNSSITAFDNKGTKEAAISYIFSLKDSFHNFSDKFYNILELTNIPTGKYLLPVIEEYILHLYNNEKKEKSLNVLSKFNVLLPSYKRLLKFIVKNDDDLFLKNFLNSFSMDYFSKHNFNEQRNSQHFKNFFYFSLENKAEKVSKLLFEYYPDMIYNLNSITFSMQQSLPILSVAKDSSLFFDIILKMDLQTLIKNFNHIEPQSNRILNSLLNNHYSEIIESKTIEIINSNIEVYEKINILKSVFESNIPYEKKFFLFTSGLEDNIIENYSYVSLFNSFIFSIQKKPEIDQNLFDQFINEFKLRNLISEDQVFNQHYFSNVDYFNLINNNQTLNQINLLNFVEPYLKNAIYAQTKNDSTDYIWYKIAQIDFKNLESSDKSSNALHLMLINRMDKYVNFFSKENLYHLLSKDFSIRSYKYNSYSEDFFNIVEKLLDSGFSFKEENRFLQLLSCNPTYTLLDKIVKTNCINIQELSEEENFWTYVKSQSIFDYCVNNKASLTNPQHIFSLAYDYDNISLSLYLENKGNIDYQGPEGNILHSLCQYDGFLNTQNILTIVFFAPELATHTNKQNKFPVSYLISDFNKICQKNNNNKLKDYYSIIKSMFECGLHSDNKKALNTLESQLLKYTSIFELFPELLPTLRAGQLNKKLENEVIKNNTIKKKVVKI